MTRELDTNVETPEVTPPPLNERPSDGPGSGRGTLRKQLESAFDDDRKGGDQEEPAKKPARAPRKVAGGAEIEEPLTPPEGETPEVPAPQAIAVPEGFAKE